MFSPNKRSFSNLDWQFVFLILALVFFGLVFIAEVSSPQALKYFDDRFYFFKQQVVWSLCGLLFFFLFSKVNYRLWCRYANVIFLVSVSLLILVIIPSFGTKVLGARRWLSFGSFSLQPSELAKFALILYFARMSELKKGLPYFVVPLVLLCFLIMLQPDLGTTIVIFSVGMAQLFIFGINPFYFSLLILISSVFGFMFIFFSDYRRARLMTFLKQATDPLGRDYHITQVLISLGLGGLWGAGLGGSKQKYLFLPEVATDSIFAIIAEEVGFVGSFFLMLAFIYLIYRGLKIAILAPDTFSKLVAFGFVFWVGIQVILNLGSMTALFPLTGIPLPFISYGGSSLVMLLSLAGVVANISGCGQSKLFLKRRLRKRFVLR